MLKELLQEQLINVNRRPESRHSQLNRLDKQPATGGPTGSELERFVQPDDNRQDGKSEFVEAVGGAGVSPPVSQPHP